MSAKILLHPWWARMPIVLVLSLAGTASAGPTTLPSFVEDPKNQAIERAALGSAIAAAEAGNLGPLRNVLDNPFSKVALDRVARNGWPTFIDHHPRFGPELQLAEQLLNPTPPPVTMPPTPSPVMTPTPPVLTTTPTPTCPPASPVVIPPVVTSPTPGGSPSIPPPLAASGGMAVPEPSSLRMIVAGGTLLVSFWSARLAWQHFPRRRRDVS